MFERFEDAENLNERSDEFDESLHRNFRPSDESLLRIEQAATEISSEGDWVDLGIQDVSVDAINTSDSYVQSESDFQKVSHTDMIRGFDTLEKEVRPAVKNGADNDYFRNLDQERGLDYPNGSQRVYEAFYGNDAIRLNKIGNSYEVVNGYHRLYVAKEMGVSAVPARVIEKRY